MCNNNCFGGNSCSWIIILLVIWLVCCNGCGCGCGNDNCNNNCGC